MEIVNLKKYITPLNRPTHDVRMHVELHDEKIVSGSGFYQSIFKREINQIHKRVFKIEKAGKLIAIVNSLIPVDMVDEISNNNLPDLEELVDQMAKVKQIAYDIMLTWPNNEEQSLLGNQVKNKQVLLKKAIFKNQDQVVRYEEEAMVIDQFSLQKGK